MIFFFYLFSIQNFDLVHSRCFAGFNLTTGRLLSFFRLKSRYVSEIKNRKGSTQKAGSIQNKLLFVSKFVFALIIFLAVNIYIWLLFLKTKLVFESLSFWYSSHLKARLRSCLFFASFLDSLYCTKFTIFL